jgi:hypothetical protein
MDEETREWIFEDPHPRAVLARALHKVGRLDLLASSPSLLYNDEDVELLLKELGLA